MQHTRSERVVVKVTLKTRYLSSARERASERARERESFIDFSSKHHNPPTLKSRNTQRGRSKATGTHLRRRRSCSGYVDGAPVPAGTAVVLSISMSGAIVSRLPFSFQFPPTRKRRGDDAIVVYSVSTRSFELSRRFPHTQSAKSPQIRWGKFGVRCEQQRVRGVNPPGNKFNKDAGFCGHQTSYLCVKSVTYRCMQCK